MSMLEVRKTDLRFLGTIAIVVIAVFFVYRDSILAAPLEPLARMTARTTLVLLHWFGIQALRDGTIIYQPDGFAYNIVYSCTAILPVTFLSAFILAYAVPLRARLIGLCICVTSLLILNVMRLVHLFHIGVHRPAEFRFWHEDVWEGVIRLGLLVFWMAWVVWAERRSAAQKGDILLFLPLPNGGKRHAPGVK